MFADFGQEAESYELGRRGYPETVFFFLKVFVKVEEPILDLGCGTGIATRQMVLSGFENVQGVDQDARMIEIAQEHREWKHIPYWHKKVNNMPFRTGEFRAATAFSSFHWFQDAQSMTSIRRVLSPKAIFFICRKVDTTSWIDKVRTAIEKESGKVGVIPKFEEAKRTLAEARFHIETEKSFPGEDLYSLSGAKQYVKSLSHWPLLTKEVQDRFMDQVIEPILKEHQSRIGAILRTYNAEVIVAVKE